MREGVQRGEIDQRTKLTFSDASADPVHASGSRWPRLALSSLSEVEATALELTMRSDAVFCKHFIDGKARIMRHRGTPESTRAILNLAATFTPMPIQLQMELVDERKSISHTKAGMNLSPGGDLSTELRQAEELLTKFLPPIGVCKVGKFEYGKCQQ